MPMETLLGSMEGAPLLGTLEEKMSFQRMGCRMFCRRGSLSVGSSWGTWGGGPFTGNCDRDWKEGSRNGAPLFMGALLVEPGSVKGGSGDTHLFPWGPHWET